MIDAFVYGTGTAPTVAGPDRDDGCHRHDRRHGRDAARRPRLLTRHDRRGADRRDRGSGRNLEHGEEDRPQGEGQAPEDLRAASAACSCSAVLAFQVPRTMKMLHPPNANDSAALDARVDDRDRPG